MNLKALTPDKWICTASMAAAMAFPRKLEDACEALDLPHKKDKEGHRVMLKLTKPRKATKHNQNKWHNSKDDLLRVIEYCESDIYSETELFLTLPELSPKERQVWILDQQMNMRGVRVDRDLVLKIIDMVKEETEALNAETVRLTNNMLTSTTQTQKFKEFLKSDGVNMSNLQAKTISDLLASDVLESKRARRLLEIRQTVSKVSNKKYIAYEHRTRFDGVVRDLLMYHGASTGRFSGKGLQIHNLPQGRRDINSWKAVKDIAVHDLEFLRVLYGEPMELFSTCIRSMILPHEGNIFFRGDFSQIEVRVLFWMAGHELGLEWFREKRDLYKELASRIYELDITTIDKDSLERTIGKHATLGCGFGIGADKFQLTCAKFGKEIEFNVSMKAVTTYREVHFPVPRMWKTIELAAMSAVKNPGKSFKINKCEFYVSDRTLWCKLPSGRKLAYYEPTVEVTKDRFNRAQEVLHHYGVNSLTRKWEKQRTWGGVLTENVVQATARDLLVDAMLRLQKNGYTNSFTVHDEIITENSAMLGDEDEFKKIMCEVPSWAKGIPVDVDVWSGPRYKK